MLPLCKGGCGEKWFSEDRDSRFRAQHCHLPGGHLLVHWHPLEGGLDSWVEVNTSPTKRDRGKAEHRQWYVERGNDKKVARSVFTSLRVALDDGESIPAGKEEG